MQHRNYVDQLSAIYLNLKQKIKNRKRKKKHETELTKPFFEGKIIVITYMNEENLPGGFILLRCIGNK